jgi:hypothetical protein
MKKEIRSLMGKLVTSSYIKNMEDAKDFLKRSYPTEESWELESIASHINWQFPCLAEVVNDKVFLTPMQDLSNLLNLMLQSVPGNIVAKAQVKAGWEHMCQRDKGGKPYVYHTTSVAMEVLHKGGTEEQVAAAFMHDVVEDTKTTLEDLEHVIGFPQSVVMAVDSVSKRKGEPDEDYIKRVSQNQTGRIIKIADLRNNMDITRLKNRGALEEDDLERIRKYGSQYDYLVGGQVGV